MATKQPKAKQDLLTRVNQEIHEAKHSYHDKFCTTVEGRYRAYRGVLERRSEAQQWTSKLHPPYAFQIVETITANMIDDQVRFSVRPRPFISDFQEIEQRRESTRAVENLLRYQFDIDRFHEKQRPFCLQSSITGLTVGKPYWRYEQGTVKRLAREQEPILDEFTGMPVEMVERIRPKESVESLYDDPCFEVVDVRDFIWSEGSTSLETAPWVCHRVWKTMDELKDLERQGIYSDVSMLGEEVRNQGQELDNREESAFKQDRTKGRIEVLEFWDKAKGKVVTIGAGRVVLRDQEWPFWHGQYPFVVTSGMPDLFKLPGVSDIEIVQELQEMLWTIMNQRLDNLSLINNAIILYRDDIDDPEAFEFAPGERWMVPDPQNAVNLWQPTTVPAEVSLQAEALLKGDIQNITGGMPFMSGTESSTVDQTTATGVSIITSLAQKRLAAKRQNYVWAFRRVGEHFLALSQQFLRQPRLVPILGKDAALDFIEVDPEQVQGRWNLEVSAMSESMMRQERRAEAQALLQTFAQIAPIMAAVQQPINMRAAVEEYLRAFEIQDYDKFFAQQPQPQVQQQGQPGQNGQQPQPPGQPAASQTPMSPVAAMQQAQSYEGGFANMPA